MHRGYIKIWRCIEDSDFYFEEKFTRTQAWIDLVMLANFKDGIFFLRGNEVVVKRGFVGWSEDALAKRWRWSRDKVRRFKKMLEIRQQIRQHNSAILNQIEIVNYDIYQPDKTTDKTTERQQTRQQKNNRQDNRKTLTRM